MAGRKRKEPTWGERSFALIECRVRELATLGPEAVRERDAAAALLSAETRARLDAVLAAVPSYRDGTLIQLAYRLTTDEDFDLTYRQPGARTVAKNVGTLFASLHVRHVKDAYQIIAKNTTHLIRNNVQSFDDFLVWACTAPKPELTASFNYVAASTALTARPVDPMPELDRGRLTFAKVAGVLNELLDTPSGGTHEQFTLAAFLEALIDEYGAGGPGGLYAETKNINASDASAGTAADVQIKRGNRTEEAIEVTANAWSTKVAAAAAVMRSHDLQRVHIAAMVPGGTVRDVSQILADDRQDLDISVLDVRALVHGLMAFMRKPARAAALTRLYELLDRKQPDIDRTNAYVGLLRRHGVAL